MKIYKKILKNSLDMVDLAKVYTQDDVKVIACLEKFKEQQFAILKGVEGGLGVYDLKYTENRLNALELVDEGEITFNGKVKILRKYVNGKTQDSTTYDHYTRFDDTSITEKKGVIGIAHGFAQCSDTFVETGIQLAMNGYIVFAIDLEGYGFTSGARVCGLKVEKFHH